MSTRWATLAWLLGLASCQAPAVFGCDDDEQCQRDSARGFCEINGFCSFPDGECASGRRYSELAGNGLDGLCVLEEETSSTSSASPTDGTMMMSVTSTTTLTSDATTLETASTSPTQSTEPDETSTTEDPSSSSTGPTMVPEDGLVLWIPFDREGRYEDLSMNGHDGTCTFSGCPASVAGPVGMAAQFDGVDDRIDIEDHPQLRFDTGMSVSLWATNTGVSDVAIAFGKSFEGNDRNSYELYAVSGPPTQIRWSMDAINRSEGNVVSPLPFVDDTTWVHLAGSWDGDTLVFYVDGEEVGSRPQVFTQYDTHPVTIGGDLIDFDPAHHWEGSIDEVRVYDRPLEPGEVVALFREGQPPS